MIKVVKRLLKRTPVYPLLRSIYRKIRNAPRHRLQRLKTKHGYAFKKLGAEYDRWIFVDNTNLNGCTIISAGLGEDGSFDVEFAKQYNAKVIIVDPTPLAIEHFNKIKKHIGNLKTTDYSEDGKQPIEAYDLSGFLPENLTLIPKALWNETTKVRFSRQRIESTCHTQS